jgi:hypothetical protein
MSSFLGHGLAADEIKEGYVNTDHRTPRRAPLTFDVRPHGDYKVLITR